MMVDWAVINVMLLMRTCAVVPLDNVISSGRVIEFDNSTSEIGTKFNTDDTTFNIFLIFIVFMICVYIEKIYYEKYIMKYIVG